MLGWISKLTLQILVAALLQAMYQKQLSVSVFQQMALVTRAVPTISAFGRSSVRVVLSERSVLSDYHVFAKVNLCNLDLCAYELTHAHMMRLLPKQMHVHLVLLDAPHHTLLERIAARERDSESAIAGEYMRAIGYAYEDMLEHGVRKGWQVSRERSDASPDELADRVEALVRRHLLDPVPSPDLVVEDTP